MALSLIYSSLQLFYFLFLWLLRINFCRQHPEMCFCIWNCRQQSQHNGANEYTTLPIPSHLLRMRSAEREQIRIQIELAIIMVSSCISALGRWTHMARRLVDRHCCVFVVFFFCIPLRLRCGTCAMACAKIVQTVNARCLNAAKPAAAPLNG